MVFGMDLINGREKDIEVDLESGLPLIEDNSRRISIISGGFVGGSVNGEARPVSYLNESNLSEVSVNMMKVVNKAPAKEKRKKASGKKASKPPRPPQGPSLDAADHKLIREMSELAMLKRARIERMKALKKMKTAKASSPSSNSSSIVAMIFTVIFFIVIICQGMSSPGKGSVSSFQGSPVSAGGTEEGLISVQYQLNPSSYSNAPGSEYINFVQRVSGSDLHEKLRTD